MASGDISGEGNKKPETRWNRGLRWSGAVCAGRVSGGAATTENIA